MCYRRGFGYDWQGSMPFWRHRRNWGKFSDFIVPYAYGELDEDKGIYTINVVLPGVEKNNIEVKASAQSVRVNATRANNIPDQADTKFKRLFQFRYQIDPQKVVANYNNGLLKLEIPLVPEPTSNVNIS